MPDFDGQVRNVMGPLHVVQAVKPVSRIGPFTTRAGVERGLCAFYAVCTASNSDKAMVAGTVIGICSDFGVSASVREQRRILSS
ncbi:hypothetical protein [Methylobacterium persicinum]|uniref:Uncharacterized protein n=1 Tax=Methylobacterium persicinum TaxID=374426 RepID=A0ABU0HIA2_9HYPH|nr:hypothetical protein [Methylobacterium persicinum]MDQ0442035.1 hypothetical protein [Methylobacterium persicinum]